MAREMVKLGCTVTGAGTFELAAADLKESLKRGVLRTAVTKGARPVAAAMRSRAPVRHRVLKNNIRVKVITSGLKRVAKTGGGYKTVKTGKTIEVRAMIGPTNKKVAVPAGVVDGSRTSKIVNASRYAHLVEFGTAHSKAQPFMRPAVAATKNQALAIVGREIKAGIAKAKAKAAARAARVKGGGR